MRLSTQIFLGTALGLGACVWLTFTVPRANHADNTGKPVFTPIPTASTPAPSAFVPSVAGKSTVKILTYNLSLQVTDPIADLVYGEITEGSNTWVGFTTKKILAKYPDCKAGSLGVLVRAKATPTPTPTPAPSASPSRNPDASPSLAPLPTKTPYNQPFKKTIGDYTYSYRPSYSACADDQAGRNELAAARAAVKNAALPTLSN